MFLQAAVALLLAGCEIVQPEIEAEPEPDKFELSISELKFTADKAEESITLMATSSWSAEITEGSRWLNADPMKGEGSAEMQSIKISVSKNKTEDARSGKIKFTMEGGTLLSLDITQEGIEKDELSLSATSLNFGYKSSTQSITLNTNQEWSVSIGKDSDWVIVAPQSSEGKNRAQEIEISVVTNTRGSRTAEITFTGESESQTLEIHQSAPLTPGDYFIGALTGNRYSIAKNITGRYGYLLDEDSRIDNGFLGYADNVFTFHCTSKGYTIQDRSGMYYCSMDGYIDFTKYDQVPDEGGIWAIMPNADGTFSVTNDSYGGSIKFMENRTRYGVLNLGDTGLNITLTQAGDIEERPIENVAISEIIMGADNNYYKCTGYVAAITNTTYGNFYLRDYSGELYVYGTLDAEGNTRNFLSLGIEEGDIVTVSGPKTTYGSITELVDVTVGNIIKVTDVSIQDFLAQEVSDKYYRLTGIITSITNTTYGNFYITDSSGATVYVYGLVSGWNGPSKQFAELNLKEGDEVTIVGNRYIYNTTDEVMNAFYVSHISK